MKKGLLIVSIVAVVVAVLGLAGFAVAQARGMMSNQINGMAINRRDIGPGMMNGPRGFGSGSSPMGPGWNFGRGMQGPMQQYMLNAVAKALDITPENLQTRLNGGASLWQIAQEKGMTQEQFQQAMSNAFSEALKQAVADGKITQAQADAMSKQMPEGWENGFGPGFPMMGPGGRWNKSRP